MEKVIENIKSIVVQIATPYSTGTGFYVPQAKLVLTNEHVISGGHDIVIEDLSQVRQRGRIVFVDELHDLAMIKVEHPIGSEDTKLEFASHIEMGQHIVALGHPYGLPFTSTLGIISNKNLELKGISYIMHDAVLNPGNSGGPLIDENGQLVGMNSSVFKDGKNISVALDVEVIAKAIKEYEASDYQFVARCPSCQALVEDRIEAPNSCLSCGYKVSLLSNKPPYQPIGIAKKVENILTSLGYDPVLCRRGQFSWEMKQGSAVIQLNYHTKSGYLLAQSKLCQIPAQNVTQLYEFLLKANYEAKGVTFSVHQNTILCSLLIYDQHMNEEVTKSLIEELLVKSDYYDDIIINEFG